MASTFSSRLRLELVGPGEQAGLWDKTTNRNLGTLLESAIAGSVNVPVFDTDVTLTTSNGGDDQARYAALILTGAPAAPRNVIVPAVTKLYVVRNTTMQPIGIKTATGLARVVSAGGSAYLFVDGVDVVDVISELSTLRVTGTLAANVTSANVAAALQTPRMINGTNFDGTMGITTTTWGTPRNITLGNTTRSVNGSTNYTWSLADIGAPATDGTGATGTWPINITGNAATATVAMSVINGGAEASANVAVTTTAANANYPFVLSPDQTTGGKALLMDSSGGTYNPSTNTAAINISGNAATATTATTANTANSATTANTANSATTANTANSATTAGSATNASNVQVNTTATNAEYPFVLSPNQTSGQKALLMDSSAGTYNPSTNTASINISGTAGAVAGVSVTANTAGTGTFFPVFSNVASGTATLSTDNTGFTYSPGGNTIGVTGISADFYNYAPTTSTFITNRGAAAEQVQVAMNSVVTWIFSRSGLPTYTLNSLLPVSDNSITLGQGAARYTQVFATTGTIQTSDARTKTEITDSVLGLDFINALRPVSYKYIVGQNFEVPKDEATPEQIANGEEVLLDGFDGEKPVKRPFIRYTKPGSRTHFGLLSQEVKAALGGVDFAGWTMDDPNDPESRQGLRYDQFISPLIKAVQELKAQVDELKQRLDAA